MHEQSMEFGFLADTPQRKTKEGLISQVKRFWKETDVGAIPVALAAKILKCSPQGIYKYIKNGKIRGHRFNNTVLVSVQDVERLLDQPRDVGGRPKQTV